MSDQELPWQQQAPAGPTGLPGTSGSSPSLPGKSGPPSSTGVPGLPGPKPTRQEKRAEQLDELEQQILNGGKLTRALGGPMLDAIEQERSGKSLMEQMRTARRQPVTEKQMVARVCLVVALLLVVGIAHAAGMTQQQFHHYSPYVAVVFAAVIVAMPGGPVRSRRRP